MIAFANVLRVYVALAALVLVGLSAVTMARFWYRMHQTDGAARYMARHVVLVASSHLILTGLVGGHALTRWGEPAHIPALPLTVLGSALSLLALVNLRAAQRTGEAA